VLEAQGRLAVAEANLTNAELSLQRQLDLAQKNVESVQARDEARRARDAAAAEVIAARGQLMLAQTYLDWCTIRAPINGTILEKLVDPDELVVPQSFGGTRGPSTALVSLADLNDLQVEIDLNEADTPKVHLNQRCRVSPEAYPDKTYSGYVAEIAPEANRSKGTLQVKVQVEKPDRFLTPELTAKVDFLAD
jgi:HlyD family secretion protein